MPAILQQLINDSEGRYFTAEEQAKALEYARSLPIRLDAAQQVEKHEDEIVRYAVEQLKARYPRLDTMHERAWSKAMRDFSLVLRYAVHSMILDDPDLGEERLYVWFRTILGSLGFPPAFVRESYAHVWDGVKQAVSAEAAALIEPHMRKAIDILSDFPEPATVLV